MFFFSPKLRSKIEFLVYLSKSTTKRQRQLVVDLYCSFSKTLLSISTIKEKLCRIFPLSFDEYAYVIVDSKKLIKLYTSVENVLKENRTHDRFKLTKKIRWKIRRRMKVYSKKTAVMTRVNVRRARVRQKKQQPCIRCLPCRMHVDLCVEYCFLSISKILTTSIEICACVHSFIHLEGLKMFDRVSSSVIFANGLKVLAPNKMFIGNLLFDFLFKKQSSAHGQKNSLNVEIEKKKKKRKKNERRQRERKSLFFGTFFFCFYQQN